jgi:hypothetical protein
MNTSDLLKSLALAAIILAAVMAFTGCAEYPGSVSIDTPWFSGSKDALGNISIAPKATTIVIPAK